MANLNLTHSGNMNITSASLGSGGTLNVQYEPNTTGAITGWTVLPEVDEVVCGQTLDVVFYPQFSGTVLTENFTVSGYDQAGILRSDTSTLRQGFDSDVSHYFLQSSYQPTGQIPDFPGVALAFNVTVNSFSVSQDRIEFNVTVNADSGDAVISVATKAGSQTKTWSVPINTNPDTGDTGTVITSLELVPGSGVYVDGNGRWWIYDEGGFASASYTPSNAIVNLVYSGGDDETIQVDPNTGELTLIGNDVSIYLCVTDTVSGLRSCVDLEGRRIGPDTGAVINMLAINVPAQIIGTGQVGAQYSPTYATVDLHYSSNLPSIASVDEYTGEVTVYDNGNVTFCVRDNVSGLQDCMPVNVLLPEPGILPATSLTIWVDDTITDNGWASATYEPVNADVSLYYSYEDTDIIGANRAGIDRYTGQIIVRSTGTARFCVEDQQTGLKDCKVVNVIKSETPDTGDTTPGYVTVTYEIPAGAWQGQTTTSRNLYNADANWNTPNDQFPDIPVTNILPGYIPYSDRYITPRIVSYSYAVGYSYELAQADIEMSDCEYDSTRNVYYFSVVFQIYNRAIPDYGFDDARASQCSSFNSLTDSIELREIVFSDNFLFVGDFAFNNNYNNPFTIAFDLVVPENLVIGESVFERVRFKSVTIRGNYYYQDYIGRTKKRIANSAFGASRYTLENDDRWFPVFVDESQVNNYLNYYNEKRSNVMASPWEGWVTVKASSITITVNDYVGTGDVAGVTVTPSSAEVLLVYSSNDTSVATVDSNGYITVHSIGTVTLSVTDTISNLSDSKTVTTHPNITSLQLHISSAMTGTGSAYVTWVPNGARTNFVFTTTNQNIATISSVGSDATITATGFGEVGICVTDTYSNISVCEYVDVKKFDLEIVLPDIVNTGTIASVSYPAGETVNIVYSSSDTSIATINASTGEITALQDGVVQICATDTYGGANTCKTVTVSTIPDTSNEPFTLEILTNGTIGLYSSSSYTRQRFTYTINGQSTGTISATTNTSTFNVNAGDVVCFFGNDINNCGYASFRGTAKFNVRGNIMSLIYWTPGSTTITANRAFTQLFSGCTNIEDASLLSLPADVLTYYCYGDMFANSSLKVAPAILPATTLVNSCYYRMFDGCTGLTTAPQIIATTLANGCCYQMFRGCRNLTETPVLLATNLAANSYDGMFSGCWRLNRIECLALNLGYGRSTKWLAGDYSGDFPTSGTFVKNPNSDAEADSYYDNTGYDGIPFGWTVVDATL